MNGQDHAPGVTRTPPGPVGRWFMRAPRYLYRLGLGRLLGRRFVMIEHTGRTSGLRRETVVEVIHREEGSLDVAAAWGSRSNWYRNVVADPSVRLSTGRLHSVPAVGTVLAPAEAADVLADYARRHPRAARALGRALGLTFEDPSAIAAVVPVLRFALT